eukprot:g14553.t1
MSADDTTNTSRRSSSSSSSRGGPPSGNHKRDRTAGNSQVHEKREEPEQGENSDSTSENNDSGVNGAPPKMKKKRPRERAALEGQQERRNGSDHMNDSFTPVAAAAAAAAAAARNRKESPLEGKEGDGGGRTCVSCRKSKVKCSKGSPCKRCCRLKLECIAQVRGRGRPVASGGGSSAAKKTQTGKSEGKGGGSGIGSSSGGGGGVDGGGSSNGSTSTSSNSNSSGSFVARKGSGVLPSPPPGGVLSSSNLSALRAAGSEGGVAVAAVGGSSSGGLGAGGGVDTRKSFGLSFASTAGVAAPGLSFANTAGVAAPVAAPSALSCPPPLGYNGSTAARGSSFVADDVGAALGGGGGGGGGGVGYGYQDFDPSSRPFPPHLLSSGRPVPPSAAAQHPQQPHLQQGAPHGSFPAARTFTHPLLPSGGGVDDSGAVPARMATVPGRPPMAPASTARRGCISSGGSWRAVFHGDVVGGVTGPRAKGSSSLSGDGGALGGGFNGKDLSWAETIDEHKDAVAAAAAAADGEEFLARSGDEKARWLMDVEQYAGACGADSDERSPEADEGGADPTDTIVTGFWRLFSEQEVHRPKAVIVIRHWALCALDRRSTRLMRKTVNMARALCIDVAEILNDYSIYAMFHELLREAEAGNTIEPARSVTLGHQEAPPYIQELLSRFAAVSTRVVLRGQSTFFHNEMCARLFMSTVQANELYASNKQDVWATCIHPDDHTAFFDRLSTELFRAPGHKSEFTTISKCREHTGAVFLARVHFRYEFQDEGNYAAFGLSILPLPESGYLQKVAQPPILENGHKGTGAAGAAATPPAVPGAAASTAAATAATAAAAAASRLCDASLAVPGSSVRSSVTSTTSSLSAAGGPAASNTGGGQRGSESGVDFSDGGGGGGDFQPLPPLDVMHQRLGLLPSQGRADAWGSHDVGGAVSSAGDAGRGLDDSINSSRGNMNGGGREGFQEKLGDGGLELGSSRGGLSSASGWVKASSRGEMRVADGGL